MGTRPTSHVRAPTSIPRSPVQPTYRSPSRSHAPPLHVPSWNRRVEGPLPSGGQTQPSPAASATSGQPGAGARQSQPHVVSSDTSSGINKKQSSGSTSVRRKNQGAIKLVADAILEGNERLLAGLKEMNDTAKQLKTREMEMERRMHDEEMQYR
jgi:hypothetical protein